MKLHHPALAAAILIAAPTLASAELKLPRVSPKTTFTQTVGLTDITMSYSRPGVKGRKIWGELVPYGEPWRTGANEATTITLSEDVTVSGQKLAAGTYALLTIPAANGAWTVAFNKDKDLWGANGYKQENDALRVQITPTAAPHQEWLAFGVENLKTNGADLVMSWEKLRLAIPIATDDVEQSVAHVKSEVAAAKADDWRTLYRSADFLFSNGVEPALASEYAEKSVKIEPGYLNLSLLARIKAKEGKTKDAIQYANQAIKAGKEGKDKMDTRPTERLVSEWMAAD
jgi:hypothetical protein